MGAGEHGEANIVEIGLKKIEVSAKPQGFKVISFTLLITPCVFFKAL